MDALERALAASGCPTAKAERTARQVKTERKAGATAPAQRLDDTVHAAVANLVLNNVKTLLELLAPVEGPRRKNSAKRPLLNVLFKGLRPLGKEAVEFVGTHVLPPTIAVGTLKSYLTNTPTVLAHSIFSQPQVETIKKVGQYVGEGLVCKKVLEGCGRLEQRSGANNATLFRSSTIEEMWGDYVNLYDSVKKEAAAKCIVVPDQPRSKKSFWYSVMRSVRVLKKSQAHGCPICLKVKGDEAEVARLESRLEMAMDTEEEMVRMRLTVSQLKWDLRYAAFHVTRRHHQREASQRIRKQLGEGEQLWFIDYVSYYSLHGRKQNVLVLEVERKVDGIVEHFYYDFIANAPHDGYFTTAALKEHFAAHRPKKRVMIFCDNGMVSGMFLMCLSILGVQYELEIHLCPFAAYHAYSLCDAHGGHFKPLLKNAAMRNVEVNLKLMKKNVEAVCKNTTVTELNIDRAQLDSEFFGDHEPRAIEGVRTAGHIKFLPTKGHLLWRYLIGRPVDVKSLLPELKASGDSSADWPTWLFWDCSGAPSEGASCRSCTAYHCRPVSKARGHVCLFQRRKGGSKKKTGEERVAAAMAIDVSRGGAGAACVPRRPGSRLSDATHFQKRSTQASRQRDRQERAAPQPKPKASRKRKQKKKPKKKRKKKPRRQPPVSAAPPRAPPRADFCNLCLSAWGYDSSLCLTTPLQLLSLFEEFVLFFLYFCRWRPRPPRRAMKPSGIWPGGWG